MPEGEFVIPGDMIGTSEEFIPGKGTYEDKGNIYAVTTGRVVYNKKERSVSVEPVTNTPPTPREGDIVIGRVTDIKGSVALVELSRIKGHLDREIAGNTQAAIHISNVKDSYVQDLSREFGYQDIVKAKVIDTKNMRLSTVDKNLGVLTSQCQRCRVTLVLEGNRLKCPKCEKRETRKLSSDYGKGII
ncbi:putative RNA-binding protein [Methanocella conradii HZ254]|uniref:Exosome complex component Csl4 n=1 Tax=Methanocella conradii (strain DSM 24694 / JCM 17849 / CGMCC 1.5162 / HZ254) TaxID=1041930 RepID=H8I9N2_METCZ|nr:exosome complex RNA-binding protein Csl4 [Methanocella conradii]AFD00483.1 putative RNA-binding protein [Methanocella conradii HZ254]MDI6895697.1 exosome complex RNA-binding protein Csl4 [Methanocella conradii]